MGAPKYSNLSDDELMKKAGIPTKSNINSYKNMDDDELSLIAGINGKEETPSMAEEVVGRDSVSPATMTEQLQTPLRSMAQGLTGGLSEPAITALQAPILSGGSAYMNARDAGLDFISSMKAGIQAATDPEELQQAMEFDIERRKELKAQMPVVDVMAQIGGAVTPGSVPSRLFGAAGTAVSNIPGIGQAAGFIPSIIRGGLQAGLAAAPTLAVSELSQVGSEGLVGGDVAQGISEIPEKVISGVGEAAKFGAAIPGAIGTIKGAAGLPKKLLAAFGGVRKDVIDKYLSNSERINNSANRSQLVQSIKDAAKNVQDDFDSAKINIDKAKILHAEAVKEAEKRAANTKIDISEEIKELEQRASFLFQEKKEAIKAASTPLEIIDQVDNSLNELKNRVIGGSSLAVAPLENSAVFPEKGKILSAITKEMNKLKVAGALVGEADLAAYNKLGSIRDRIKEMKSGYMPGQRGERLQATDVKKIIQSLDKDIEYLQNQRDFSGAFDGAAAKARRSIDSIIKEQIPEYGAIMEDVSKNSRILAEANKMMGDKNSIALLLKRISNPQAIKEKQLLKQIGDEIGIDFSSVVGEAEKARSTLASPTGLLRLKSEIPDAQKAAQLRGELSKARRPGVTIDAIERETSKSKQAIVDAEKTLLQKTSDKNYISELLGKDSAEKSLETFLSSSRESNIRKFERLSQLTGQNFIDAVEDLKTLTAFSKEATQGSRNVNLWKAIGTATGVLTGIGRGSPEAVATFGMVGAGLGAYLDKYGPETTKKILDGVIKIRNNPTVQQINSLKIPDQAKKDLVNSLNIYNSSGIKSNKKKEERKTKGTSQLFEKEKPGTDRLFK